MLKYTLYIVSILILASCEEYITEPTESSTVKTETKIEITDGSNQIVYLKNFDLEGNLTSKVNYRNNIVIAESDFEYNDLNQTEIIYNHEDNSEIIKYSESNENTLVELISDSDGNIISEKFKIYDSNGNLIKIESKNNNNVQVKEFDYKFDESGKILSIYVILDDQIYLQDSISYETNKITRFVYNPDGNIETEITSVFENNLVTRETRFNTISQKTSTFIYRYTFW